LAALAAAGTGLMAEESVAVIEPAEEVLETHERLMQLATGLAVVLSVVAFFTRVPAGSARPRHVQVLLLAGLLLLAAMLSVGADRGGQLVYQYGVGGTAVPPPENIERHD
jgi:uncharacterized membrane protein